MSVGSQKFPPERSSNSRTTKPWGHSDVESAFVLRPTGIPTLNEMNFILLTSRPLATSRVAMMSVVPRRSTASLTICSSVTLRETRERYSQKRGTPSSTARPLVGDDLLPVDTCEGPGSFSEIGFALFPKFKRPLPGLSKPPTPRPDDFGVKEFEEISLAKFELISAFNSDKISVLSCSTMRLWWLKVSSCPASKAHCTERRWRRSNIRLVQDLQSQKV